MTDTSFNRMLEEIYSNFGKARPAFGTPMYNNLHRRICEGQHPIPDEAAQEIAYAFERYDSFPQNLGKAIYAEFSQWRASHAGKIVKRSMCPDCDPRAGAGYVYLHDAEGKCYNPWLPETLRAEKDYCQRIDPEAYAHIWGGEPRSISDAQVFKNRYVVEPFETPDKVRFFHGADWGFAKDPTVLVRCFVKDDCLYVDREAYGVGVELDELPQLFDSIETSRKWPIKADSARPETISMMKTKGFNISAAKKWAGSVEDGIALLKGFKKIVIHPDCKHAAEEFRLYSYKVDRVTEEVLPIIVGAHDHVIDSLRYSLDGYVKGSLNISPDILGKRPQMTMVRPSMRGMM